MLQRALFYGQARSSTDMQRRTQSPVWYAKNYGNRLCTGGRTVNREGSLDRTSQASKPDREPRSQRNDCHHDGAPHHRCHLFRTPATRGVVGGMVEPVSYTHLRAHETDSYLVCRLLLEKKKKDTK